MKSLKLIENELRVSEEFSKFGMAKEMIKEGYELKEVFSYINENVTGQTVFLFTMIINKLEKPVDYNMIFKAMKEANIELRFIIMTLKDNLPTNILKEHKNKDDKKIIIKALIDLDVFEQGGNAINDVVHKYKETDFKTIIEAFLEENDNRLYHAKIKETDVFNIVLNILDESVSAKVVDYILTKTGKDPVYVITELTSKVTYDFLCSKYTNDEIINFLIKAGYVEEDNKQDIADFIEEIEEKREELSQEKKNKISQQK